MRRASLEGWGSVSTGELGRVSELGGVKSASLWGEGVVWVACGRVSEPRRAERGSV